MCAGRSKPACLVLRCSVVPTSQPLVTPAMLSRLCHFGSFCVVFLRLHARLPLVHRGSAHRADCGIRASSFFSHPPPPSSVPLCVSVYVRVFIIQGHSLAPHGSIPYPGRHGYRGHLSQRVPADQTGVHPDDVSPPPWLLGTFVRHNAQVLVADREKTSRPAKTLS